jgi:diguanylate cyclase (GGDEF)-like protein
VSGDDAIRSAMSAIWERSRDVIIGRVVVLEGAVLALLAGNLTTESRRQAEREAHKLAGTVGTFGFWTASKLAREAEDLLAGAEPIGPADTLRLSNLAVQIRRDLERPVEEASRLPDDDEEQDAGVRRPRLIVVDENVEFRDRVTTEARSLGIEVIGVPSAADARGLLSSANALVLDLAVVDAGLSFLDEVHQSHPTLPVVVISDGDAFQDRVDAARLGGRGFLQRPVRPAQLFDVLRDALVVSRDELPTIVAVDDDPTVLSLITSLLDPMGAHVVKCVDPLRALSFLVEFAPDLVMLDVDMPELNGIELCRVLRNDPRWAAVPILFLTARDDPDNVTRMFEAGADDFVRKPVTGAELIARVRNRLERTRMLRLAADVDSLTGIATRRRGIEVLERFFRLAQRQRQPVSLAAIDLDHFKQVNDRFGHLIGDMVLRRVASLLAGFFRGEDVVARWGGEEFVIGMYAMPADAAVRRLESALAKLASEVFEAGESTLTVSFSAGVAEFPADGDEWTTLYRVADNALSSAKAAGRNRVVRATSASLPS